MDCVDGLKQLDDACIDMVVTSPPYDCYSDDTEVLTKSGWKKISDIKKDEEVLTLNPIGKNMYYSKVINTFCYDVEDEEMIHFNSFYIDLIVTKNHRMYVSDKKGNPVRERRPFVKKCMLNSFSTRDACNIKSSDMLHYGSFNWIGEDVDYFILPGVSIDYNRQPTYFPELKIRMDDWLSFFGLYIAEGSCRGSNGGKRSLYEISIKQREEKSEFVKNVLDKLPFEYHIYKDRKMFQFCITNCQLWHYLKQFGNSFEKYIPVEIKKLSKEHLNNFLYHYLFGDGVNRNYIPEYILKKNDVRNFFRSCKSVSNRLKDDLQEVCIKCGFVSVKRSYDVLSFVLYDQLKYMYFKKKIIKYTGKVSCIQVEKDNIIFVRRRGKPLFCGNSIRDYKGFSFDFPELAKQLYRVCKMGATVVWVVGDGIVEGNDGWTTKTGTSLRQALGFQDVGFNIHDYMIYRKKMIPVSAISKVRYYNRFEFMWILSKGRPKTINLLKDRKNTWQNSSWDSVKVRTKEGEIKELKSKDEIKPISEYGVRDNIWSYATGFDHSTPDKIAKVHPALYPEQLVEDHILSWSTKGDVVLDPFLGSGTTALVARRLNRRYIGFDISKEYCDIAKERMHNHHQIIDGWI